jgi:FAD synthase
MNESLSEYPNGIYITTIKINGKPDVYVGASSLGTNPHYENSTSKRIL